MRELLLIVSGPLEGSRRCVTVVQVIMFPLGFFLKSENSTISVSTNWLVLYLWQRRSKGCSKPSSPSLFEERLEFHCLAGGCNFKNSFVIKFSSPWFLSDMLIKLTREVSDLDSSFTLRLLQTGNKCRCAYSIVVRGKASKFLTCECTGVFNPEKENRGMLFLRHCGQGMGANELEEQH